MPMASGERHSGRSLQYKKIPRFRRNGGFRIKFVRPNTPSCGTPGTAFPTVRIPYAEREPATSREGPMVSFNHRPVRTNCQRPLAAKIPRFFGNGGFPINVFVSIRHGWAAAFGGRNAGDGVPYGPNSIRRA